MQYLLHYGALGFRSKARSSDHDQLAGKTFILNRDHTSAIAWHRAQGLGFWVLGVGGLGWPFRV